MSGEVVHPMAVKRSDRKNMMIDIDGCICEHVDNEEPEKMVTTPPLPGAVESVNRWYEEGRYVCFITARTDEHREVTEAWLKAHGFKYHQIIFNKPRGGNYHYIDDLSVTATRFNGNFGELAQHTSQLLTSS
ncbi:MAG: phosphoheptose isomerase [Candidatus Tectomicrobia bacterium]|nr:phosphoheptose isomerase [Candidatus Tectomicrobia bacterium]